jgi:hypothetical protein
MVMCGKMRMIVNHPRFGLLAFAAMSFTTSHG